MSTLKIGKFAVNLLRTDHDRLLLHDDVVLTVGGAELRFCANDLDDLLIILRLARERALTQ